MEDMDSSGRSGTIPDEVALLAGMQAGDDGAFEACVRGYCGRMLVIARRILGNEADAEDAVQDAFASAFQGIGRFHGLSSLGTWLHRIVVNAALGRLRHRQRHPEQSIEDLLPHFGEGEHQVDPPAPWKATPETGLQAREARELVRSCISRLPESYRTVLLLRDIEGLDTEETARLLGTSPGVVKTRLHRARQALRTLLDPHFRRGDV
jgi:RNA polymerase sigma-70 factor (ECF subfamily)